jgi:hypothetical protein
MDGHKERDIDICEVFNRRISQHDGDLFSLDFEIHRLKTNNDILTAKIRVIEKKLDYLMSALIHLVIFLLVMGLVIYKFIL